MGIYIPNMKKPTDCGDCDFYRWGYCHIKHARVECEDGVDADCPLIEVTEPHGRLIDADVLLNQWCEDMCKPKPNCEEDCAVYDYVRLAPTVIEAEGE